MRASHSVSANRSSTSSSHLAAAHRGRVRHHVTLDAPAYVNRADLPTRKDRKCNSGARVDGYVETTAIERRTVSMRATTCCFGFAFILAACGSSASESTDVETGG